MYVNHPCKLGILANKFELSDLVFHVLNYGNEIKKKPFKINPNKIPVNLIATGTVSNLI